MSRVRSTDTLPERLLRSQLHRRGWRFRKNVRRLPGCPDVVFPALRVAVFVDGDFWHGYRFEAWQAKLPEYWRLKIERNRARDKRTRALLRRQGWSVVRVWEHEVLRDVERAALRVERLLHRAPRPASG